MDLALRPNVPLHIAVIKNNRQAIAKWHAASFENWYRCNRAPIRGFASWAWDKPGDTLLHYAARAGDGEAFVEQLKKGYSPFKYNAVQESPLTLAVMAGHANIVREILKQKVNQWFITTALSHACTKEVIEILLKYAQGNKEEMLKRAICNAIDFKRCITVHALLSFGVSPNETNRRGTPLLSIATTSGETFITKILLESGADIHVLSSHGEGILHCMARAGSCYTLPLLIDAGANINQPDFNNKTPLFYAVENGKKLAVVKFLKHGASVNHQDNRHWTALHEAAYKGRTEIALLLLDKGADPNAVTRFGKKPWELARSRRLKTVLYQACFLNANLQTAISN